jgi:hypothetical protein
VSFFDLGVDKELLGFVQTAPIDEGVDQSGDGAGQPEQMPVKTCCLESVAGIRLGVPK